MLYLRNLIFWLIFYAGSVPTVLLAYVTMWLPYPMQKYAVRGWSVHHYLCCRWILGIRVKVEGELAAVPVLYAIKHESMYETIDMPRLLSYPSVITKQELFDIPFWGRAAKAYGMIPIDRAGGASALRSMLKMARKIVEAGRPIIIYPEGTRVAHGTQVPLQPGFAGLYKMLGLPVVPIAVDSGARDPSRSGLKRPGVITYKIGEMIPAGLAREELEARVHTAINRLNGDVI